VVGDQGFDPVGYVLRIGKEQPPVPSLLGRVSVKRFPAFPSIWR
jgi:hypothetical protein